MTVSEARGQLWHAIINDAIHRADEVDDAIDVFASAVRAETLAPATRGQSAELAHAEGNMRKRADAGYKNDVEIVAELDRLRAALAAADARLSDVRASKQQSCCNEARANADRVATLEAENAELRKLCGRACAWLASSCKVHSVPELPGGPHECIRDLESAARRAGK